MSEQQCGARWLYRGKARAVCHGPLGHAGRHWNGTVQWSDSVKGAVPANPSLRFYEADH